MVAAPGARELRAQRAAPIDMGGAVQAGGEEERYLRVLQIAGLTPLTPWSIQPFSPSQTRKLRGAQPNPWSDRLDSANDGGTRFMRPHAEVIGNSSFPYQVTHGPTWAGRGLTGEIRVGAEGAWHGLHMQLAPMAFLAQNAAFPLAPNGGYSHRFADPRFPRLIDAPQRFGDRSYGRIDPGESFLAFDGSGLFIGVSTAANQWGPGRDFPLVLGPNAGGFPSAFAGTSEPVNLWIARLHARVVYGELGQSAFSDPVGGERKRLGSGVILDVIPRGIPGLELGLTRFNHDAWPQDGLQLSDFERPFAGGLNLGGSSANVALENQIASLFARWAVPAAKAEFYGEFYREDYPGHFHSAISLIEAPDDFASFMVGFQHVLAASPSRLRVLRAELVNGEASHQERLQRDFSEPLPPYTHTRVRQGNTLNGLILGSPDAYGGSGWRIGLDDYTTGGRRSVTLERSERLDWLPTTGNSAHPDVLYAARLEWLRFGTRSDYGFTLVPAVDLNRNLVRGHDVLNLAAAVTVTGW
jgi:hypothetical protein